MRDPNEVQGPPAAPAEGIGQPLPKNGIFHQWQQSALYKAFRAFLVSSNQHIKRHPKRYGMLSRFYRELVNGGDSGYTLLKAGVIILLIQEIIEGGLSTVSIAVFGVHIAIAAAIGGAIYIASALKDEYDRIKEKEAKVIELHHWQEQNKKLQQAIHERLAERMGLEPLDEVFINISTFSNGQLLKLLLRNYLRRLGLEGENRETLIAVRNSKRKLNGRLPGEGGIVRLIESVIGAEKTDPYFANKLELFLNQQEVPDFNNKYFIKQLLIALDLRKKDVPEAAILPKPKIKSIFDRFARVVKNSLSFIHKSNTAYGLVLGTCLFLGIITAGTPIFWPIILVGALAAVISGASSMLYGRYVEKHYTEDMRQLESGIRENKVKFQLLYKLDKLQDKQYNIRGEWPAPDIEPLRRALLGPNRDPLPAVTPAVRTRIKMDIVVQGSYGLTVGVLVGIAISSVLLMLVAVSLPPIGVAIAGGFFFSFLAAGGVLGGIYGARFAYALGKAAKKAGIEEIKRIEEVSRLQEKFEARIGKYAVRSRLVCSKQELVAELIKQYTNLNNKKLSSTARILRPDVQDATVNTLLTHKELILQRIEEATGILRPRDLFTHLPVNEDPAFYQELSLFLQKEPKTTAEANTQVTAFKAAVLGLGREDCEVNERPSFLPTWQNFSAGVTDFNRKGLLRYGFPFLAALGIGLPLGFAFAPGLIIPIAIFAGVILTIFIAHKVMEASARRNLNHQADIETKLPLIESIIKTTEKCIKQDKMLAQEAQAQAQAEAKVVEVDAVVSSGLHQRKGKKIPQSSNKLSLFRMKRIGSNSIPGEVSFPVNASRRGSSGNLPFLFEEPDENVVTFVEDAQHLGSQENISPAVPKKEPLVSQPKKPSVYGSFKSGSIFTTPSMLRKETKQTEKDKLDESSDIRQPLSPEVVITA